MALSNGTQVPHRPEMQIFRRETHYQGVRSFGTRRKIPAQVMQRLFSAFPDSLPGAGLLLLRLCDGLLLLVHSTILSGFTMSLEGLAQLIAAGAGGLILVGLATPFAAAIGGVIVLFIAAPIESRFVLATIGAGLALLGPGAWSIDARLCGRRRIDIDSL
jgi:putative oxidoreductase